MRQALVIAGAILLASAMAGGAAITGVFGTLLAPLVNQDPERAAFALGQEYVFTTGNNGVATNVGIPVAAGSLLNVRICNTSATRTWYIGGGGDGGAGRFFDTNSANLTPYYGVANPDALSTAQAATLSNGNTSAGTNLNGTAKQTDITFTFGVGSAMTVAGAAAVPSGVGGIYPGMKNEINHGRGILPGTCFGQALVGQAAGLASVMLGYRAYIYYLQ